jgi:hypothetical protein
VTELKNIEGITVKLKKRHAGTTSEVPRQRLLGTVTRDGRPVRVGWVGLWSLRRPSNAVNVAILRGRTVTEEPIVYAHSPIRDGAYALDVPFQHEAWYVVAEEPGRPLTQVGPIAVALNEERNLDIACTDCGIIRGRVRKVPEGWEGYLWVVAFTETAIREEARVGLDGAFSLRLPPGEYGLKVGHDAYDDADVPSDQNVPKEVREGRADPWRRAKAVTVKVGRESEGVELELPQ